MTWPDCQRASTTSPRGLLCQAAQPGLARPFDESPHRIKPWLTFKVRLTRGAEADLDRLFDFLLERELSREGGDASLPAQAIAALRSGISTLQTSPFTCRKAGQSPFLRELIVPFGRSGYVALFEIEDGSAVAVLAVRRQLEDDYH